jgi:GNAT superfamily N-acetyltransferase
MSLPNQLIIRAANLDDVESIITFSAAMALETENRQLNVARLREGTLSLIGQLMITYEWSDWRNGVFWWIQSVYVDPAWRRRGVFRRIHEAVVSQAKADVKVCGLRLYVEQDNHTAEAVYQRVGLKRSVYKVYEEDFVLSR